MSAEHVYLLGILAVALMAAGFDWKTGKIPNRLTLGAILVAFPLHAYVSGGAGVDGVLAALKWPLLGALVCAVPPAIAWKTGWMGGGDVKLMAAMGAVGGVSLGLESVFLGLLSAGAFVLLRLAWNGAFLGTVGNGVAVAVTRSLRRKHP